tara:strand:- start:3441 stop:4625 length:1185 start_codon:yes stop_codon:yes gene_type:complete
MALNFGELLGGIGAAIGGTAPQYVKGLKDDKQSELVAREKALYQDAAIGLQLFESGQLQQLDDLGRDRMDQLRQFSGAIPNDTLRMLSLNKLAMGGDRAAAAQLHAELISANKAGQVKGYLAAPDGYTLSQGQTRFEGDQIVANNPAATPEAKATFSILSSERANDMGLPKGKQYQVNSVTGQISAIGGGDTTINTGAEGNYGLPASVVNQFSSILDTASRSAAVAPQLSALLELADYTTEGNLGKYYTELFPTLNEANTAFSGIVYGMLPSMRDPGSGSQSDKDIDVLINSIGNITYTNEVKKFLIQAMQSKNEINQELADVAEKLFSGEITGGEAVKANREINKRTIIPEGLAKQLANITGFNKIPPSAVASGVTQSEWNNMTPADRKLFEE